MKHRELFKKALLAQAVVLSAANVHAQQIEEVVVTAQKRTESLQDVPVSVSAISGNELGPAWPARYDTDCRPGAQHADLDPHG